MATTTSIRVLHSSSIDGRLSTQRYLPISSAHGRNDRLLEVISRVLLDEGSEVLEGAVAIKVDEFARSSRLELEGGHRGDAERS